MNDAARGRASLTTTAVTTFTGGVAPGKNHTCVASLGSHLKGRPSNAAAAAGQTFACELICNFGATSATENAALLADLKAYGNVDVARSAVLADTPTGTAYILLFDDNDNAIVLIGGANQEWPEAAALGQCGCLRVGLRA